jgi:small conductance mechanosensitive channel
MDPTQILNQILSAAGISATTLPEAVDLSLWNILRSLVILVAAYFLARWTRTVLDRMFKRINLEPRVAKVLLPIVFYGIISLAVIWVLGGFGLSILILGVAAGFVLQDLLKNFAAGMLILTTRPFQQGDWILVQGNEGIVAEVGWRGTFIDAFDGRRIVVPNMNIVTNVVTNNSVKPQLRSALRFSVPMKTEFAGAEKAVLDALQTVKGISPDPAPRVLLDSLSGDAMNLVVWIWILDPMNQFRTVQSEAQRAIKEHLQAQDIVLNPATTVVMSKSPGEKLLQE